MQSRSIKNSGIVLTNIGQVTKDKDDKWYRLNRRRSKKFSSSVATDNARMMSSSEADDMSFGKSSFQLDGITEDQDQDTAAKDDLSESDSSSAAFSFSSAPISEQGHYPAQYNAEKQDEYEQQKIIDAQKKIEDEKQSQYGYFSYFVQMIEGLCSNVPGTSKY
uniref:Uncharacterized protein n=1 Tax=Chaetoceros debilis TaxID=122233 RepID=A0A6S8UB18_9STRA|eukprot:CAMPEP_0194080552 /NCGR_PEP_ID=MMETSP0149-20130528/6551_1 /TAXON_ID=122233 /ORGANISM="Chaetoceros debilis, Strain MM31A-1" /LENGTH=162 /DNA_ID=CAMNT_0038762301 /DNA_START=155 /DNA_END=646 /DNA_ORIENTATION=+